MSIFAAYDSEFSALSQDINKNISDIKSCSSNALLDISTSSAYCDEKKSNSLVKHVDALLIQAGDLIKQMEVEIRSHDAATRKVLSGKVSEYKKSLALLKAEYERTREESQRAALLGSSSSASQDRYATVNGKLKRQNESIANAHRSVAETEDVALEITQELNRNREKIKSAHSKVHEFAGMTDTARRLIHSMNKREVQQKFILVFISLVLIAAIGFVIYLTTK